MRELTVTPVKWEWDPKKRIRVLSMDATDDYALVHDPEGRILCVSVPLDGWRDETEWLARRMRLTMQWTEPSRGSGIATKQRLSGIVYAANTFGFTAPVPLRRRYAAKLSNFDGDYPDISQLLAGLSGALWSRFTDLAPAEAEQHNAIVEARVHPDWWLGKTPFTSGIMNKSAALPYHVDRGNIKGTWSMMLSLRQDVGGGFLHVPELGLVLSIPHRSVTFFDGQHFCHGVTPLERRSKNAYRYTLVWYTKVGFVRCGSAEEEGARAQRYATDIALRHVK